tara:strand:+ start:5146 stop:5388 length:243 start_codon:yes stop_codon:yes gene_type:complete
MDTYLHAVGELMDGAKLDHVVDAFRRREMTDFCATNNLRKTNVDYATFVAERTEFELVIDTMALRLTQIHDEIQEVQHDL